MSSNVSFVRVTYLVGIVLDGFWSIVLAFPTLYRAVTGDSDYVLSTDVRTVFIIAASLMLGWTVLLCFGYRKPIERRFILLITAFPAVFGIFIATLFNYINGSSSSIFFTVKTFLLFVLFISAFYRANKEEKIGNNK